MAETLERIPLADPDHSITTLTAVTINKMKASQLRVELKACGVPTSGKKMFS